MFGSIGMTELIVIMVVALVVIGPKRLPELARTLGKALGDFKRATSDFQSSFSMEDDYDLDVLDEEGKEKEKKTSDEESDNEKDDDNDAGDQEEDKEEENDTAEQTADPIRTETDEPTPEAGDAEQEVEAATENEATADKTEPAREDDKQT